MSKPNDYCSFIRKSGKQCKLKPDNDTIAIGFCYRHRQTKKEPFKIDTNFCSFIRDIGKQCKLRLRDNGRCFRHFDEDIWKLQYKKDWKQRQTNSKEK